MKGISISWKEVTKYRDKIPPIYDLAIIEDYKAYVADIIKKDASVLDVGCSDGNFFYKYLRKKGFSGYYAGVDTDKNLKVNFPFYASLREVEGTFDVVLMFDVIEHMSVNEFLIYLDTISNKLLKRGGVLFVSTLNTLSPFYLHLDVTHITFYPYYDLYGILRIFNFNNIKIYRVGPKSLIKTCLNKILRMIYKEAFIDFYGNILIMANLMTPISKEKL